jgi:hypothetical protein
MSWSVTFIGKPENVSKALKEHSTKIDGYSKEEFDAALPHLDTLISQNFNAQYPDAVIVKLIASGHGQKDSYGYCVSSIETMNGVLV